MEMDDNREWVGEIREDLTWVMVDLPEEVSVVMCCGWSESRGPLRAWTETECCVFLFVFSLCLCCVCFSSLSYVFFFLSFFYLEFSFCFWGEFYFIICFWVGKKSYGQFKGNILRTYVPHYNQRQLEKK